VISLLQSIAPRRLVREWALTGEPFDESIAYTESRIALLAMAEDAREGLKAFGEKRKPSWPGK
jgi:methylglutaconyl-CoA hydratase